MQNPQGGRMKEQGDLQLALECKWNTYARSKPTSRWPEAVKTGGKLADNKGHSVASGV